MGMRLWHFYRDLEESVEGIGGTGPDRIGEVLLAEDLVGSKDTVCFMAIQFEPQARYLNRKQGI